MRTKLSITEGIFPMPVLMVATYNEDGSVNVMNAAWGTMQERETVVLNLTETHKTVKNIKARGAFTVSIADAAQLAFRTEGNQDFVREFRTLSEAPLQATAVKIKCKVPCPIQVCPILSHKLRERMLRSGHCFHKNLHSAG